MRKAVPPFLPFLCSIFMLLGVAGAQTTAPAQSTILYGAAYYNEYMPADLQPGRLEKDVEIGRAHV